MSETVHTVTDLPVKTSVLRKVAKRTAIASAVVVAAAALYLKSQSTTEVTTENTSA